MINRPLHNHAYQAGEILTLEYASNDFTVGGWGIGGASGSIDGPNDVTLTSQFSRVFRSNPLSFTTGDVFRMFFDAAITSGTANLFPHMDNFDGGASVTDGAGTSGDNIALTGVLTQYSVDFVALSNTGGNLILQNRSTNPSSFQIANIEIYRVT